MPTISFGPGIKLGQGVKIYNPSDVSYNFTSGYITLSPSVTVGTLAYTVDLWFNVSSFAIAVYFFGPNARTGTVFNVRLNNATTVQVDSYISTATAFTVPNISTNIWHHLAVTRNSSGLTSVFLNGVRSSTAPTTISINYAAFNLIGGTNVSGNNGFAQIGFPGYISNFRFISGSNIYDPNATRITVPTSRLTSVANTKLLTGTNASGGLIDLSGNETLTATGTVVLSGSSPFNRYYYSGSFNGTSRNLSLAANTAFTFGTGDFTIEFWFNGPSQLDKFFYDNRQATATGYPHVTTGASVAALRWGPTNTTGTVVIGNNTWHHCAVTRQSGTIKLWVDGVLDGSASDNTNYSVNYTVNIARNSYASANWLSGYISNFRVVKGTAVYTGNFTPPTNILSTTQSASTNIAALTGTETSLLTLQDPTIVDNSTNNFTITNTGTVPISTTITPSFSG